MAPMVSPLLSWLTLEGARLSGLDMSRLRPDPLSGLLPVAVGADGEILKREPGRTLTIRAWQCRDTDGRLVPHCFAAQVRYWTLDGDCISVETRAHRRHASELAAGAAYHRVPPSAWGIGCGDNEDPAAAATKRAIALAIDAAHSPLAPLLVPPPVAAMLFATRATRDLVERARQGDDHARQKLLDLGEDARHGDQRASQVLGAQTLFEERMIGG